MYMNVESIFRPLKIGPVTATNRLMRSATHESAADREGLPLVGPMKRIYGRLAQGGIGIIVTGHTFVHPNGRAGPKQSGMQSDGQARAWEPILETIHSATRAPVMAQLTYAGRQGFFLGHRPPPNDHREKFPPPGTPIGDFSPRQIDHLIKAFGEAAARCVKAGFDGVQIHMAHGYLLSECLSFHTNRRDDGWGGEDPANRRQLPMAVVAAVRQAIGDTAAVMVKLNGSDNLPPDGIEPGEAGATAAALGTQGVDLIEVSCGMAESGNQAVRQVDSPEEEGYLLDLAVAVAKKTSVAVATVGGYRSAPMMLKALSEGMDVVSLSRPLVREPDFPNNINRDSAHTARCISCNKCFDIAEGALRCTLDHAAPIDS